MPVVSTVAGASLQTEWKKCINYDGVPVNGCSPYGSAQRWTPSTMLVDPSPKRTRLPPFSLDVDRPGSPRRPSAAVSVGGHLSPVGCLSAARRAPFRSLNGRAYAVPLNMVKEFDAICQKAQKAPYPPSRDNPLFSPLRSPGVLWRHDPYSVKVLNMTLSSSSENHLSVLEDDDDECGGSKSLLETGIPRPIGVVTSLRSRAPPVHPPPTPSWVPAALHTAATAAGAVTFGLTSQPMQPSTRPMLPSTGCRVVVHSVTPPRPAAPHPEEKSSTGVLSAWSSTNSAAIQEVRLLDAGGKNVLSLGRRQSMRFTCERDQGESCPSLLPAFRAMPPLFLDLAAHTTRRPPRPGKRLTTGSDGSPSRPEEARYIYLVGHRCRRSVCAAGVLYNLSETVVLEGDMGIDMGIVQAVLPVGEYDELSDGELSDRGFPVAERHVVAAAFILRVATADEVHHYNTTLQSFTKDLFFFLHNHLVPSKFSDCRVENMEFLGCEFQADCKKVYVYYRAKRRVLFRELAQYLHSFYRCRIWLHEVGRGSPDISGASTPDLGN